MSGGYMARLSQLALWYQPLSCEVGNFQLVKRGAALE